MADSVPVARPFAGEDDLDAILELLRAVVAEDKGGLTVSVDDLRFEWIDDEPGWVRNLTVWDTGGKLVASFGAWHELADEAGRAYGEVAVHPDWREPVFVDEVVAASIDAVAELVDRPVEHRLGVASTQEWLRSGVERAGYTLDRVYNRMCTDITGPVPVPPVAEGFEIRPLAGEHEIDGWVAAFNAGFADHHDPPTTSTDEKRHRMVEPGYRAAGDLVLVGPDGTIVGVGRNSIETLDDGTQRAWVNSVAIVPEHRGKGLGKALLARSINALYGEGFTHVRLTADSDNASGALQLYESAGFRIDTRMTVFVRSIEPR
ncbi:MAG: GNAT family N-acetyltransferase [Chloroflexota bacterium]|nr:GNAT family N-acetyltransferase [Chloroflexota bacterium]